MIIPGIVSVSFRQLTPKQIVDLVISAGLKAIEWGGDIHVPHGDENQAREVGALTRNHGLEVAAYGSYYRVGHSEEENLPFLSVLHSAKQLGAPVIRVWAGNVGSYQGDPSYREKVIVDTKRIATMAQSEGIRIAFEYHENTLTDTNDSALNLIREIDHQNLRTFWQPPNGASVEYCLEGLQGILPWLENIHIFHWWPTSAHRHGLSIGKGAWERYLKFVQSTSRNHFGLIEFVKDDKSAQFLEDAQELKRWLRI